MAIKGATGLLLVKERNVHLAHSLVPRARCDTITSHSQPTARLEGGGEMPIPIPRFILSAYRRGSTRHKPISTPRDLRSCSCSNGT